MFTFHQKKNWGKFSLVEQLAYIGSEVDRTITFKYVGDKSGAEGAAESALELMDMTLADKRWKDRLKEVLRLREVFCDYFYEKGNYNISSDMLRNYFFPFNIKVNPKDKNKKKIIDDPTKNIHG